MDVTDKRHPAWEELRAANDSLGWVVGPPGQRHGGSWAMYAFAGELEPFTAPLRFSNKTS